MNPLWEILKGILVLIGGLIGAFVGFIVCSFVFSLVGAMANPEAIERGGGGAIVWMAMLAAAIFGTLGGGAATLWFLFKRW